MTAPTIIAFFNHKGGVGKTTLVYNVGLALAREGHRILFVDGDPQANLTSAAIPPEHLEELFDNDTTISACLAPLIDGSGDLQLMSPVPIRETAWILPGSIHLSEFEEITPQAWTEALAGNARGFRVSTALLRLINGVGARVDADYALLDLGPNVGAMNRTAILASSGFVVPLAPDLFSLSALPSVGRSVALWIDEWRAARGSAERRNLSLGFDLPIGEPSPLGYVSQQFAVYRQAPAAAYRRWIDQIPTRYEEGLVAPLRDVGIRIPEGDSRIGEVKGLSSLIPMAQRSNRAVFELTGSEARGAQYTRAQDTYELFRELAEEIISRVRAVLA
jgi:chromosome partitioning protein